MKLSASLFAGALLVAGFAISGHAMASEYSMTASERIAAANELASQPLVPGVHVRGSDEHTNPVDEMTQSAMAPGQNEQQTANNDRDVVLGGTIENDVQVRDPNVPFNPNRTFQGWWKD